MLLVDRLAATGVKRAAGAVTRNRLGFLKAAATQPKGQRAQLDSQPADADPFIVWYPVTMGDLFSTPSAPSTARFYEGITLLFGNPNKEFPQNFDPTRPFKTELLRRVSRASFVDSVNGRNGPSRVVLLEDPTTFKLELESPLEVELLSRQGFVSRVKDEGAVAVVRLEDFLKYSLSPTAFILKDESPLDVELCDNATFILIHSGEKGLRKRVDDMAAWQRSHAEAEERHVGSALVKLLQKDHTDVEPFSSKSVYGPGGKFKEIDAAAISPDCAMVAGHKHVMSMKGVEQLQRAIAFILKYRDQDEGNVSLFRGKRIIGVLASAPEVGGEKQEFMNTVIESLGYKRISTDGLYGDDPCSTFQASGDSCDISSPSDTPGTSPNAPPSAVPRRGGRSFLAPMRGPAMLVRPRLVNNRVTGFRLTF
ncbi:hypothetical protein KSW81_006016 [Nannochloris sp. 'desiccata']|nr:hypothetical protein KSW81_006016 [Chlorella desiccata (nom. nud.)]